MSEYTKQDRIKRLNHQHGRLVGKINYMNRLTSMGRKFGRNTPCPCRSGKRFKKCCIVNHEYNSRKVSALQVAMDKLLDKVSRYGFSIGRVGVRS
jgi:hypothetical protein